MQAAAVRELFETVLPRDLILEKAARLGVQKRQRAFDPALMVFALVLLGGTAEAGRLAAAVREYFDRGGTKVARSAYYRWFDAEFLELMKELDSRARAYLLRMPKHLPGVLAGRSDWRVFDSTTVRLSDKLREVYSGTGDYAAIKVHMELSLGIENVVAWHITPARDHDAPHLVVDESRRGSGLIVDLGYVSHDLLRKCHEHDVHLVVRLKNGWKVRLDDEIRAGQVCEWTASEEVFACFDGASLLDRMDEPLDVDVRMGGPRNSVRARLVNVETPEGFRAFLTTVPRETHDADAIAFLYQLRWSIELQNKLAKSGCQLDEITAERPVGVEILVHAAMLASMIANAVAHLEHLDQGAVGERVVRLKRPPLHAMLIWKCVVTGAWRIAELLASGKSDDAAWAFTAENLRHGGQDPNWKRTPSPIDDAKGRNAEGRARWRRRAAPPRRGVKARRAK
jgi:hypothetical protein